MSGYKRFGSVLLKMHPDHIAWCVVVRSHGFRWNRRTRTWRLVCEAAEAEFATTAAAYEWCLYNGTLARMEPT